MTEFDVFLIGFGFGSFAGAGLMAGWFWLRRWYRIKKDWFNWEV